MTSLRDCAFPGTGVVVDLGQWLDEYSTLLWWVAGLSAGSLLLMIVLLPRIVARLPADHFVAKRGTHPRTSLRQWAAFLLKNALGVVFVIAGILMLLLPGQGLLTLLIGLLLVDFPGKRAIELKLVRRPRILQFLNAMRHKRGVEPLRVG